MDTSELAKTLAYKATLLELQHYYEAVRGNYYPVSMEIPGLLLVDFPVLSEAETEALSIDVLRLVRAYRSLTAYNTAQTPDKPFPSLLRGLEPTGVIVDDLIPGYTEDEQTEDVEDDTRSEDERQIELVSLVTEVLSDNEWHSVRDIRQKQKRLRTHYTSDNVHYLIGLLLQHSKLESRDTGNTTEYRIAHIAGSL